MYVPEAVVSSQNHAGGMGRIVTAAIGVITGLELA